MLKRPVLFLTLLLFTFHSFAQQERRDKIIASYMIAFGAVPQQSELNYWLTDPLSNKTVMDLVNKHRENMKSNQQLANIAINNSYLNVMGNTHTPKDIEYLAKQGKTYTEMYVEHMRFMKEYPEKWKAVVELSYLRGMNRAAKKEEVDYWVKQTSVRSMAELLRNHYNNRKFEPEWNRIDFTQQQKGVVVLGLSGTAKEQTKVVLGNLIPTWSNVIATGGLNVIATGGLN